MPESRKMNIVITGFNEHYWTTWGSSWIASLFDMGFKETIYIVDCGLYDKTKEKIESKNITVVPCVSKSNDIRYDIFLTILSFSKNIEGKIIYWDTDVFFQEDIQSIFDLVKDKFVSTKSQGFLGASSRCWQNIKDISKFYTTFNKHIDSKVIFESIIFDYKELVEIIDDTWNYTDISDFSIENNKVKFKNQVPKVIHFTGINKDIFKDKNIFFHERFKEKHLDFLNKKPFNIRPIFKK